MQWKKDPNLKYTDLCMYIDANITKLTNPGEFPDIEDKVYNYLWLLVKALAIKKRMFTNFQDYDSFAFHAANRLFFALRKNQINQGKTIKGKLIRPIKSCLNYTKALLYPMKVEYQQENYKEILSEEYISGKFDSFNFKEQLKANARASQGVDDWFRAYLNETLDNCASIMDRVLAKSPFNKNSIEYKRLKISLMLNCIYILKTKRKLDASPAAVITWKLPKSMANYIRILLKEFITELKIEIMDCHKATIIDDHVLEAIISSETEQEYEKQY